MAAGKKAKGKLSGARAPSVPAVPAFTDTKAVPTMATPLSAFERAAAVAEGAKAKLNDMLEDLPLPDDAGGLKTLALPAVAVGATAVGVGGGALLAHQLGDSKPPTVRRSTRKKASAKKGAKKKPAKKGAKKKPGAPGKREDRSGVTRSTYRGQKVYTHKGRKYVIRQRAEKTKSGHVLPKGSWKFIPQ